MTRVRLCRKPNLILYVEQFLAQLQKLLWLRHQHQHRVSPQLWQVKKEHLCHPGTGLCLSAARRLFFRHLVCCVLDNYNSSCGRGANERLGGRRGGPKLLFFCKRVGQTKISGLRWSSFDRKWQPSWIWWHRFGWITFIIIHGVFFSGGGGERGGSKWKLTILTIIKDL